jgi:hypothetical protein
MTDKRLTIQPFGFYGSSDDYQCIVHKVFDPLGVLVWIVKAPRISDKNPELLNTQGEWEEIEPSSTITSNPPTWRLPEALAHTLGLALLGKQPIDEQLTDELRASRDVERSRVDTLLSHVLNQGSSQ